MDTLLTDGTNFKISSTIYDTLCADCFYFNFTKNESPNISGFLNHLIHHLSEYREDLHNDFLKNNNNNNELALLIEQNIYNVYLKTFDISDDSKINIPLRINKQYSETFATIFDKHLYKYDMNFTNYIKTLLFDYASRPLYQREYFHIYRYSKLLFYAQKKSQFINIRTTNNSRRIVPVGLEKSYLDDQLYIFGFSKQKEEVVIIKYSEIKTITLLDEQISITDEDYEAIFETMKDFFDKLKNVEVD